MAIDCCNGCVPPKRTPTCKFDGTCNRYAEAKKKHDADREAERQRKEAHASTYAQRTAAVRKATRRWRRRIKRP